MKQKRDEKKLTLKKMTIAHLDHAEMRAMRGGAGNVPAVYTVPCFPSVWLTKLVCPEGPQAEEPAPEQPEQQQ